jgi:O-antigen/teichoic acid export membrane protein
VLLDFSTKVGFSQLVDHLSGQGFTLLIGKLHGVAALGLYNRAQATQYFASGTLGAIFKRIALPLFSSRAGDLLLLRDTVKKALQLSMLVNLPIMVGLSLTSDLVILNLFGAAWAPAAPILSVLALAGIFWPMHIINGQLLLAIDRPDLYWRTEVAKKTVGILCILVGSAFGIMGLAWSQVIFSLFAHFFNGYFSAKHLGYGAFRQIQDVSGVALICGIMAAAVLAVRPLLDQPPLLLLCSIALLGVMTYGAAGLVARIEEFKEARRVLIGALARR